MAVDFISEAVHRMHQTGKHRQGSGGEGAVFSVRLVFDCTEPHTETGHVQLLSASRWEQEGRDREILVEICCGLSVQADMVVVTHSSGYWQKSSHFIFNHYLG